MSASTQTTHARNARPAPWADDDAFARPPVRVASVLVCDDDDDTRETIATLLWRHGFQVLEAMTGAQALYLARTTDVSALILDIMLPDCTGFDVCQDLRRDPRTRRLPVVMVTALTDITHESTAIVAGADAYLVKPARRQHLIKTILTVI